MKKKVKLQLETLRQGIIGQIIARAAMNELESSEALGLLAKVNCASYDELNQAAIDAHVKNIHINKWFIEDSDLPY